MYFSTYVRYMKLQQQQGGLEGLSTLLVALRAESVDSITGEDGSTAEYRIMIPLGLTSSVNDI
jgi:hypothetical protein